MSKISFYYSEEDDCWKVERDGQLIEGDISWCVSELIRDNLMYKLGDGDHTHSFDGVLQAIIESPETSDMEGDRNQYSEQELRMIDKLKRTLGEKTNNGNTCGRRGNVV